MPSEITAGGPGSFRPLGAPPDTAVGGDRAERKEGGRTGGPVDRRPDGRSEGAAIGGLPALPRAGRR